MVSHISIGKRDERERAEREQRTVRQFQELSKFLVCMAMVGYRAESRNGGCESEKAVQNRAERKLRKGVVSDNGGQMKITTVVVVVRSSWFFLLLMLC